MKPIPFLARKPRVEIVSVGSELTGCVYLQKKGYITPNENPVDFQEAQKKQRDFFRAYNQRVKELSKELNLSTAEVRNKLSGLQTKDADPDAPKGEVDEGESMFDYLDDKTLDLMMTLQEDARTLAIRAATYMLQYRAAIPVILKEGADAGARKLKVEALTSPVGNGTMVRFGDYMVTVRNAHNYMAEEIEVADTKSPLKAGDVGYICDAETTQIKLGFPDWSVDDTQSALGEELIAELYRFYQVEAGEAADVSTESDEEVKEEEPGESPSLVGATSTSDSNTSDVVTLG